MGVEDGPEAHPSATVVSMRRPFEGWKASCCISYARCGCGAKMSGCCSAYGLESGSQVSMGDGAAQVSKENESKPWQDGQCHINASQGIGTHHLRVRGGRRVLVRIRKRRGRSTVLAARRVVLTSQGRHVLAGRVGHRRGVRGIRMVGLRTDSAELVCRRYQDEERRAGTFVGRGRRRSSEVASCHRGIKTGDDLRDVTAIEFIDGLVQLHALLSLNQQLRDLLATLRVLRAHLPHLPLLRRVRRLRLRLGPEGVAWVLGLVLFEHRLGLVEPDLLLGGRKHAPGVADDLRECAVVRLDSRRDVVAFNE